jgi:heme exporter protein A
MLKAHDLSCIRGERLLFKNLSFELKAGGLVYVLGDNGSGKSSLLKLLCGLLTAETGSVLWCEQNIRHESEVYQSNLTYIGHLNGLKDELSALENLNFSVAVSGKSLSENQLLAALTYIGMERYAHLPVGELSQGQKRRVALARLWLTTSPLWILDEPFAALDTAAITLLASRLTQHLADGGMVVMTSHQDVTIRANTTQTLRLGS